MSDSSSPDPDSRPKRTQNRENKDPEKRMKSEQVSTPVLSSPSFSEKSFKAAPEEYLADHFRYRFNENLLLEHLDTREGFKFTTQAEYEKLGKVVKAVIQSKMENSYGLVRTFIPLNREGPKSYIYSTPGVLNSPRPRLLLLIQGAGAVRPGIWARSVCINDSLNMGSMLPFLQFAQDENMEVLIFNPNKRRTRRQPIPENQSLEAHSRYMWRTFISGKDFHEIYIVAHSCGGLSTLALIDNFWEEFKEKVVGIAFTDAVHGYFGMSKEKKEFLRLKAVDWVASKEPLDKFTRPEPDPIVFVSSGHKKHEYTTGSAQSSIMTYLREINTEGNKYLQKIPPKTKSSCFIN
jgi:hypothetical protein